MKILYVKIIDSRVGGEVDDLVLATTRKTLLNTVLL